MDFVAVGTGVIIGVLLGVLLPILYNSYYTHLRDNNTPNDNYVYYGSYKSPGSFVDATIPIATQMKTTIAPNDKFTGYIYNKSNTPLSVTIEKN